jgi:anti-sigma factor RsiW
VDLTCRELVEIASDYLEGALDPRDRAAFEHHLTACEGCAAYLEQMRATIAVAGRLREDELDPAVRERLLTAFRGRPGPGTVTTPSQ